MNDYWLGLLTLPLAAVAIYGALVALQGLIWVSSKITVGAFRVVSAESSHEQRARLAAVTYATKRCWVFTTQDLGIALYMGQDVSLRRDTYDRIVPKYSLEHSRMEYDDGTPAS